VSLLWYKRGTPAELAGIVKSDTEMWAATVKQAGFKPID
jgi:hypothetical protein